SIGNRQCLIGFRQNQGYSRCPSGQGRSAVRGDVLQGGGWAFTEQMPVILGELAQVLETPGGGGLGDAAGEVLRIAKPPPYLVQLQDAQVGQRGQPDGGLEAVLQGAPADVQLAADVGDRQAVAGLGQDQFAGLLDDLAAVADAGIVGIGIGPGSLRN